MTLWLLYRRLESLNRFILRGAMHRQPFPLATQPNLAQMRSGALVTLFHAKPKAQEPSAPACEARHYAIRGNAPRMQAMKAPLLLTAAHPRHPSPACPARYALSGDDGASIAPRGTARKWQALAVADRYSPPHPVDKRGQLRKKQ